MPIDNTIDKLIYDLDAVMNGEEPGTVEQPEFNQQTMEKMRALISRVRRTARVQCAAPGTNAPAEQQAHGDTPLRYVRVNLFCQLSGYTDKAVRRKIQEGVWLEGAEYRRAPDGRILIDTEAYEKWVSAKRKAGYVRVPMGVK
jgi:hypothetical protein